ncbi:MAG TPA: hypothetical protein VGB96_14435, partial [Archangium sp.]
MNALDGARICGQSIERFEHELLRGALGHWLASLLSGLRSFTHGHDDVEVSDVLFLRASLVSFVALLFPIESACIFDLEACGLRCGLNRP